MEGHRHVKCLQASEKALTGEVTREYRYPAGINLQAA